jgi:hypothetical protein
VDERERDLSVLVALLRERHNGEHPLRFDKIPVAAIGECGVLDMAGLPSGQGPAVVMPSRSGRPDLGNDLANGFANGRVSNQGHQTSQIPRRGRLNPSETGIRALDATG